MGEKRDAYINSLKSHLDEWNAKIDRLEETAKVAKVEAETEYRDRIAKLRDKRDQLEAKLKDVQVAGEDAWEILKEGVEKAQVELKVAFDEVKARFSESGTTSPNN